MGKLGKKARKFAKKNLQSVLKRNRQVNSKFKKKYSSRGGKGNASADQVTDATELSSGRNSEVVAIGDTSLDLVFSEDDSDSIGDSSDSDGFLSEDPDNNTESDNEIDSDESGSSLLGQNKEIYLELAKQKRKLDRLRQKDPRFSNFLEKQSLKQSSMDETYSEGEDEISDQDMAEAEVDDTNLLKNKFPTVSAIESWKEQVMADPNSSALPYLLNAYRAACHYGSEDRLDALSRQRTKDTCAFSKIIMLILQESDGIFQKLMGISSSKYKAETILGLKSTAKWKSLKPLIKSYLRSTLFLLNQVTDTEILAFSLSELKASIVLFVAFPSLLRRLIKAVVHLWATGGGPVSSSAYLVIRTIALSINANCLDSCLTKAYNAFVAHCKIVDSGNLGHLQFLVDSLVELYALDVSKSFNKAQKSIQQLARILQQGVKTKKKEVLKKIYNWQYTNCVAFWVKFISANIMDHDLQPLLYIIIQVINGVAHLFPGPRYLPLRLKCIQMLNQLSSSSGVFIPITSLVLDSLEYIGSAKPDERRGNELDVAAVLKVPKQWLKLKYFQEELVLSVIELLSTHFSQWSFHASFPDLATFPLIRLRNFHDTITIESVRRPIKRLIDQVQQNVEYVQKKRDEAAFSPKDLESIKTFLQLETCSKSNISFVQYYASVVKKDDKVSRTQQLKKENTKKNSEKTIQGIDERKRKKQKS